MDKETKFKKVVGILEDEVNSLEEYVRYLEEKNKKIEESLTKMEKYIDEDKKVTEAARNYIKKYDYCSDTKMDEEEIVDDMDELCSNMEVLHSQLCNLTKKFAKTYFPAESLHSKISNPAMLSPEECSSSTPSGSCQSNAETFFSTEKDASTEIARCLPNKSLLDVLKKLIYNLNPQSVKKGYGVMDIDDTVNCKDVEFLISSGIVRRSSKNPACIILANMQNLNH